MPHLLPRLMIAAICFGGPAAALAQDTPAAPASGTTPETCIAISLPAVRGAEGDATDVATAVRDLFTSYLQGPSIKVVALDARLSMQANEEAKQKSCDRVLIASVTHKRGGGGLGRALGRAGSTAAWYAPVGSVGAAVARSAVIAGAQAASEIASNTRAKDEVRIQYRLVSTDGRVVVKQKEEKAKASADGEDLLTPLVQTVSESIAA
ncbi:MAG: hypothetical protein EHM55_12020, partial [Acidobacteria bacterium]